MERREFTLPKWAAPLVAVVLLLAALTVPAHAADWNGARNALLSGLEREAATIDLSAYQIHTDDFNDFYNELKDFGHVPWYVKSLSWNYYTNSGYLATVTPNYLDRTRYSRTLFEQEVNKILDATVHEGMGQWQIALSIHDYLAVHIAYSPSTDPGEDNIIRNAYGAIVNKDAVCVGYAEAYQELMLRAGIPCIIVGSDPMDHQWNMVKIGGNWYHVDVTWADPDMNDGGDLNGYVSHKYFLLSDATISDADHKHYDWTPYYTCTDTSFEEDVFWQDIHSQICYMDSDACFIREGDEKEIILVRRSGNGDETVLCTLPQEAISLDGEKSYYFSNYGLSLWEGSLYFSDPGHVYSISPAGGELEVVYTYDYDARGNFIYGSFVQDDTIYITTRDSNKNMSKFTVPLPQKAHTHSYITREIEPTCQSEGYTSFSCTCGSFFTSGYVDPVDHKGINGVVVTEPSWSSSGLKVSTCRWCGVEVTERLSALSAVNGTFSDVKRSDYFCEPVLWAYVRGVTSGTSSNAFSPNAACTRAQVVTFLWRAMGEPEPGLSYSPFADVQPGAYYYKAVLWAVENGITSGTSARAFSPDAPCTRAHVVTFLHRTAGTPEPFEGDRYPFTDVEAGGYYIDAMVWAVENSITTGTGPASFSPNAACTRGQTVTFLHRYFAG